jgi:hypothetical protein
MKVRSMRKMLLLAPLAALAALPAPAAAQSSGERINHLIIYGDDPCPQSRPDEITVCARKDESERYRIPQDLRDDPNNPKNEPWTDRVEAYETVGATGIASCSPVGPGGASGCMTKLIDAAYKERRDGASAQFGRLIEAEREKRLSTIDAEAAATQARVEQLEKEYDAKVARERAAEEAKEPALPTPPTRP